MPLEFSEAQSEYKAIIPLSGIDPRKIYVLAKPHSLLIEFRSRNIEHHEMSDETVTENIECRISRELVLPVAIEAGSTTVQVCGDSLTITARKTEHSQHLFWSEFIHFDTRGSLGCV